MRCDSTHFIRMRWASKGTHAVGCKASAALGRPSVVVSLNRQEKKKIQLATNKQEGPSGFPMRVWGYSLFLGNPGVGNPKPSPLPKIGCPMMS